jgi:hypothetical protein
MLIIIMSKLCLNVVNLLLVNNLEVCDSMMEVSIKDAHMGFCWKLLHAKKLCMEKTISYKKIG